MPTRSDNWIRQQRFVWRRGVVGVAVMYKASVRYTTRTVWRPRLGSNCAAERRVMNSERLAMHRRRPSARRQQRRQRWIDNILTTTLSRSGKKNFTKIYAKSRRIRHWNDPEKALCLWWWQRAGEVEKRTRHSNCDDASKSPTTILSHSRKKNFRKTYANRRRVRLENVSAFSTAKISNKIASYDKIGQRVRLWNGGPDDALHPWRRRAGEVEDRVYTNESLDDNIVSTGRARRYPFAC